MAEEEMAQRARHSSTEVSVVRARMDRYRDEVKSKFPLAFPFCCFSLDFWKLTTYLVVVQVWRRSYRSGSCPSVPSPCG